MKQIKNILRAIDKLFAIIGSSVNHLTTDFTLQERPSNIKRKLLIDCTYLYSTNINTGIQRVVRNIIDHIEPYATKNDLQLTPVALINGSFVELDMDKIIHFQKQTNLSALLIRVKRKIQLYFKSLATTKKVYKDDIVLMLDSSWYLPIWSSLKYAKERGAKIITVAYDLIPISHPQFCDERLQKVFDRWYRDSLPYFDGYISISKSVMSDLKDYLKKQSVQIDRYQFDSFELGSNFNHTQKSLKRPRESLVALYESKKDIYLTVSTIEPRKNHRYIFETFKKLWQNGSDATWVVVGKSGWKTQSLLQEMREDNAYGEKLLCFDDLNDIELEYCYRNSKALIFASIVEGYGLPIVESLANKLPVLASDTPIHNEVGGELVTYFDLNNPDALFGLLEDIESKKRELIEVDNDAITMASWDDSARELLAKTLIMANKREKEATADA